MELRFGYQETDFGLMPEDWQLSTVGREFDIQLGKMLDSAKNSGVLKPYIGNKAVQWDRIDIEALPTVALSPADLERFRLRPGDLLVCEGGEIGRAAIWEGQLEECYYQKALHRLRPLRGFNAHLMLAFLRYWTGREMLGNYVTQTSIAHLPKEKFALVPLPVPPPQEQRAIADALSDVDALISALDQLIVKKRDLKQAAMQQLLTGKTRLPGFEFSPRYKQTEVGMIPEDWQVSQLREKATFKTGPFGSALHQSDYVYGGVPVINPMQIVDGRIVPTPSMAVTEPAARKLTDFRLSAGNVIIGRRGEMGRCAFVQTKQQGWLCGTGSMIIRTGPSLDGRYIQRVLSSPIFVAAIENASVGSTMINLNQNTLGTLLVPLPSTWAEQEAIATVLSDMDDEIAALEQQRDKTRLLRQGMMQELLTGKTRLI